jgi:tRNA(fMet)-specific endonuclease VapC
MGNEPRGLVLILDTDHISLLDRSTGRDALALRAKLADISPDQVATTIITYEEQIRGWMAYLAKTRTIHEEVEAYRRLRLQLENYRVIRVLDFGEVAATQFQRLRKSQIRVATMDLKIAAIVLSLDATLLTRNTRDFAKIPGLKCENWSVAR